MPYRSLGALLIALIAMPLSRSTTARAGGGPQWRVLGGAAGQVGLYHPTGVAVGAQGQVYVADAGNSRIVKLSPQGRPLTSWQVDLQPNPNTATPVPNAMAVDPDGNVYVAVPSHNEILRFSPTGRPLARWIGMGDPQGIAVGGAGNIWVADTAHHLVDKVSSTDQRLLQQVSVPGTGPYGLAVDAVGDVFAADEVLVQKGCLPNGPKCGPDLTAYAVEELAVGTKTFTSIRRYGTYVGTWGLDVAAGPRGDLYVAGPGGCGLYDWSDRIDHRLPSGTWASWGRLGAQGGAFDDPASIATDSAGNVYVADTWNDRIDKFSPDGAVLAIWGTASAAPGRFATPSGLAIVGSYLYVNDVRDNRVERLSLAGSSVVQLLRPNSTGNNVPFTCGSSLSATNRGLPVLRGVGIDSRGDVLAADSFGGIARFPPGVRYLQTFAIDGGTVRVPEDVTPGPAGTLFVSEVYGPGLLQIAANGTVRRHWSFGASGLAFDRAGNLYAADPWGSVVRKISPRGIVLARWGGKGRGQGRFEAPTGVALDARGDVYVADSGNDRIQELSPAGRFLHAWGSAGSGPGQLHTPTGIAVDGRGDIYVADSGNNRVQELIVRQG